MKRTYQWEINQLDANDQPIGTKGTVTTDIGEDAGASLIQQAMRESFMQVTQGKAIYGKPGVACRGPYKIVRIIFKSLDD